jgi:transcriptional regulator with XRE-family HTH domain
MRTIVGANLKAARLDSGMNQLKLAQELGVDSQYVSRWERGKVMPTLGNLHRLAEALDRDVAWFYTDHDKAAA